MKLLHVSIANYRKLESIAFDPASRVSVVVGPNAVGKSTILEALRLLKVVLMPSLVNEMHTALQPLGLMSGNGVVVLDRLLGDPKKNLRIRVDIELSPTELDQVKKGADALAQRRLAALLGQGTDRPVNLVHYLSLPEGRERLKKLTAAVRKEIEELAADGIARPTLVVDLESGTMRGENALDQDAVALLSQTLPPTLTYFNYFPADRAIPPGEVNIQIGAGDLAQQAQSHTARPEQKYARLKNHLVNEYLKGPSSRSQLESDFGTVFDELLPGKHLEGLSLDRTGRLSVLIKEDPSGVVFDIDSMSSGEKGLLLTFLLLRRTTAPGGIILLDEPELHLNPAICKKIIPFLQKHVVESLDAQIVVCTHSPEVLAHAYESDDCSLFHLRSATDISPVKAADRSEAFEAIRRLGGATDDVLFSKGMIYVEGPHDVEVLESGFAHRTSGYRLKHLGGRGDVEREIKALQEAELKGHLDSPQILILDHDGKATPHKSTPLVRVVQWDRRCLENYLLDASAIYDVYQTMGRECESRGALPGVLKSLALEQIPYQIAHETYESRKPDDPGWRKKEMRDLTFEECATTLAERLFSIADEIAKNEPRADWEKQFVEACKEREREVRTDWETNWAKQADGKQVLQRFQNAYPSGLRPVEFKRRVAEQMGRAKAEAWRAVDNILSEVVE